MSSDQGRGYSRTKTALADAFRVAVHASARHIEVNNDAGSRVRLTTPLSVDR